MTTYTGSCHCGKVQYEVDIEELTSAISCNCSMCLRAGTLLTFVPAAHFRLLKGEDALTDYQFNKKIVHHLFCATCGIKSFSRGTGPDGSSMVAINVRCLQNIDIGSLAITSYDGMHA